MAKEKKQKKPQGMVSKIIKTVLSVLLCLVLVALMFAANVVLPGYSRMANSLLGGVPHEVDNSKANAAGLDLAYNKPDFTAENIAAAEAALKKEISDEGLVLLKNEGLLPLGANPTLSLFSANSDQSVGGGLTGGGSSLKDVLAASGVSVNEKLWDFYTKGAGKDYGLASGSIGFGDAEDFRINEAPLSALQAESGLLDSVEGTVPVFFFKRVAGEGRDMPRGMYNHADNAEDQARSYLEPDSTEREILQYLNDNYDSVILVLNSNAAIDLDWVAEYPSIKAIINAPDGLLALGDVLTGAVNPSGRTVDTIAADALRSPAAQNFGDYQYSNEDGTLTKYNYVTYEEGIYVGYRYYETRYEDVVLEQGNAGDYDYDAEVIYPFGYGLSYTTFEWSDFDMTWDGDECTVSVQVTNTGDVAGKEVVEIYAQSPYTEYDKENGVEKSAVELVQYGKTQILAPGESETVTATFNKRQLASYDANGARTYIMDAGTYYVTAGRNAHDAVNNILAAKGADVEGNTDMVASYEEAELDTTTYAVDDYSGAAITNQLDDAKGDATYLTRSDWEGTFPTHDGVPSAQISTWGNEINGEDGVSYTYTKTISAENLAKLDSFDAGNPEETFTDAPVYGKKNGLTLIQLRGLDYDDPLWNDLLDQLTSEDYYNTIGISGYGIEFIESVNKPFNIDADTAAGLIYGGTGSMFPNPMTVAQTWNQDIAYRYGRMIGSEALIGGADGWYAPSMNIHRTPFSGRNGEYYSEDPFVSGTVASLENLGAAEMGMYVYIKHFAFNDQENHRGDRDGQYSIATFLNEQSAREIYLTPFEMCMKVGDVTLNYLESDGNGGYQAASRDYRAATAIMTAFNRVGYTWTGGCYNLITGIVRNEWDFDGMIITDNANTGVFMSSKQMIEAGADIKLTNLPESARFEWNETDPTEYHYAREAMHHVLYTIANSKSMNGAMPGAVFQKGMMLTEKLTMGINVVGVVLIALMVFFTVKRFRKPKNTEA